MQDMTLEGSGNLVRLMTVGNTGGWRNFANTQRRVQMPGDLAGLKIRTVVADLPQARRDFAKRLFGLPTGLGNASVEEMRIRHAAVHTQA